MRDIDKTTLNVCEAGIWSGGGQGLLSNIEFARQIYPERFSECGVPVYLRNVVPLATLLRQNYIYMPQNAWAWHGPARSFGELQRKSVLWAASAIAIKCADRVIRIGPMVPDRGIKSAGILSNVLDIGFEVALDEASSMLAPDWLPKDEYIIVTGSLWSYRNIKAVISSYKAYRQSGGNRALVIVGAISKGSALFRELDEIKRSNNVNVITRHVKRSELVFAIKNSACCVLSSLVEASPVTLLEAAAVSTGIVAWDIPAFRYMTTNEELENVLFVKNDHQLAKCMGKVFPSSSSLISGQSYRHDRRVKWVDDFLAGCFGDG